MDILMISIEPPSYTDLYTSWSLSYSLCNN